MPLWMRLIVHTSLTAACATIGGAALVWPQWVAIDGARVSLGLEKEREGELNDRWEQLRGLSERLYSWRHSQRRVFLEDEVRRYPLTVSAVAQKCGVAARGVLVNQPSTRWRTASLTGEAWAEGASADLGEIRPQSVKVWVTGSFDGVYRTVASLCAQQQAFVPERWTLAPAKQAEAHPGTVVRAEVIGTVFVVHQPRELSKPGPVAAPLASGSGRQGWNG